MHGTKTDFYIKSKKSYARICGIEIRMNLIEKKEYFPLVGLSHYDCTNDIWTYYFDSEESKNLYLLKYDW